VTTNYTLWDAYRYPKANPTRLLTAILKIGMAWHDSAVDGPIHMSFVSLMHSKWKLEVEFQYGGRCFQKTEVLISQL